MKKKLIIIGASGHGKVCVDIADKMNQWNEIYFLDDNPKTKKCLNYKVIGTSQDIQKYKDNSDFFVAIGDNNIRENVLKNLLIENCSIATLIHPQATINSYVDIGMGTVIMAGTVINSDTTIGIGCIINTSASIDHDNKIGNFVHLSPGVHLAGNVSVARNAWIGIGASVVNNTTISSNEFVRSHSLYYNKILKGELK